MSDSELKALIMAILSAGYKLDASWGDIEEWADLILARTVKSED